MTFLQDNETKKQIFNLHFFRFNNKLVFKIFKFFQKVKFQFSDRLKSLLSYRLSKAGFENECKSELSFEYLIFVSADELRFNLKFSLFRL